MANPSHYGPVRASSVFVSFVPHSGFVSSLSGLHVALFRFRRRTIPASAAAHIGPVASRPELRPGWTVPVKSHT